MDVEVPAKAKWIRSLVMEITRIASHLVWYGTFGLDTGGMGQFLYALRDREALLDILEEISGQRMMFNYIRPGGVLDDLPVGIDKKILEFCDGFDTYLEEHHAAAWRQRDLPGSREGYRGHRARDCRGLRAHRRATCVRPVSPSTCARTVPTTPTPSSTSTYPWARQGDGWDRYMVRMEEMRQANRMIRQCVEGMPEGDFTAKVPKMIRPAEGEVYASCRVRSR